MLALLQEDPQLCAVISSKDGRWRAAACSADIPSACRDGKGGWVLKRGERGQCADGTRFDVPHHSKENLALQRLLLKSGAMAAWLPLQGQQLNHDFNPLIPTRQYHHFILSVLDLLTRHFSCRPRLERPFRRALQKTSYRAVGACHHPAAGAAAMPHVIYMQV